MTQPPAYAVTGATGFVGKAVLRAAAGSGIAIRALTRRPQEPREGVTWIAGALEDHDALDELCSGADALIHIAGVVNAPTPTAFEAGNVAGTLAAVEAASRAGLRRFVHVSSLAAREPGLSAYGASKARAERMVKASGLDWTLVRPPAIYGPEDREMLDMFRMARSGWALLPPAGRMALIHVDDLARLLLRLGRDDEDSLGETFEVDDGTAGGWTHVAFAHALGDAVGRKVRTVALPRWAMALAARGDRAIRRDQARLTADRVSYFCHDDWTANAALRPPPALWQPRIATMTGLRDTADWYRKHGWLKS